MNEVAVGKQAWAFIKNKYLICRVVQKDSKNAKVAVEQVGELVLPLSQIYQKHAIKHSVADLCELPVLNQPQILDYLKERFKAGLIFTLLGNILLVINPYREIAHSLSRRSMEEARTSVAEGRKLPHIYALGQSVYKAASTSNQSVIISGQSGAGKTESTKQLLRYIVQMYRCGEEIERKIICSNPILEAFGNAKTIRNNNSSRFGKFLNIAFQDGKLKGAKVNCYLLQKTRVTNIAPGQRTFHIFYGLNSPSVKQFVNIPTSTFRYLGLSHENPDIDDNKLAEMVISALQTLRFSRKQIQRVFEMLVTILLLGDQDVVQNEASCDFADLKQFELACSRIGFDPETVKSALVFKTRLIERDIIRSPLSPSEVRQNLNIFARALYGGLFEDIAQRMNKELSGEGGRQIGLLDIFGFQNFKQNSFEQLNINFANQKIHQIYTDLVIVQEMALLRQDGVLLDQSLLVFPSNQELLDLFQGSKGIYRLLEDVCCMSSAKDQTLISACRKFIKSSKLKPTSQGFKIQHSHQQIAYQVAGFKAKNIDSVSKQINELVSFALNKQLKAQKLNLGAAYVLQLRNLCSQLLTTNINFVRCIKPNQLKQPLFFDNQFSLRQLRYLGILQTVKIRKSVYPTRLSFDGFKKCFFMLLNKTDPKLKEPLRCAEILGKIGIEKTDYIMGNKNIYIATKANDKLNQAILKVQMFQKQATKMIQRLFKAKLFKFRVLRGVKMILRKKSNKQLILQILAQFFMKAQMHQAFCKVKRVRKTLDLIIPNLKIVKQNKEIVEIQSTGEDILQGMLRLPASEFKANQKLKQILECKCDPNNIQPLARSEDCQFTVGFLSNSMLQQISQKNYIQYFEPLLCVRKSIMGTTKKAQQIMRARGRPISRPLMVLPEQEQSKAIQTFKNTLLMQEATRITSGSVKVIFLTKYQKQPCANNRSTLSSSRVFTWKGNTIFTIIIKVGQVWPRSLYLLFTFSQQANRSHTSYYSLRGVSSRDLFWLQII